MNIGEKKMSILVTGGAGYIGSHTVQALIEQGKQVVVIDNLSTGHQDSILDAEFIKCDIKDRDTLSGIFKKYKPEAVIHFAASSLVGESMHYPEKYYTNNVVGTLSLLETLIEHKVGKIVFSSTAATYGNPLQIPINESELTKPTNTYGETKLAIERMMHWFEVAYGIKYIALRYFNAAGAHPTHNIGEDHTPETHLIPIVLQVAMNQRPHISVYGNDYDTKDGTCIRDYIHVCDLADAHVKAVQYLINDNPSAILNLGNGEGYSVEEIVHAARKVTGHDIPAVIENRRAGDPAILIADATKARELLGWSPRWTNIEDIIASAWKWHKNNPHGYKKNE